MQTALAKLEQEEKNLEDQSTKLSDVKRRTEAVEDSIKRHKATLPLNEAEKRDIAALQKQIADLEQRPKFASEMARKSTGFVQRLGAEFNEIRKQSPETAGLNFIPKGNQVVVEPRRLSEIDKTNDRYIIGLWFRNEIQ